MKHIKKFTSINEGRGGDDYENKLTGLEIDVTNYDKSKYESVDTVTATIIWEDDVDYSSGGIDGIGAIVKRVTVHVSYEMPDDSMEVDEDDFDITDRDAIEVKTSNVLPFYASSLEVDLIAKTCVVNFG